MTVESPSPNVDEFLVNSAREWLFSIVQEERELTPPDLYGVIGNIYSLNFRKVPHNSPIPEKFTMSSTNGPISVSKIKEIRNNYEFRTLRYVDDEGVEREVVVGGNRDSPNQQFGIVDIETGAIPDELSEEIPKEMIPTIARELLTVLN